MKLKLKIGLAVFFAVGALLVTNHFRVNIHATAAMKSRDVEVLAYYRYGVDPGSIVFDIRDIGGGNSAASTIGGLIVFAEALSDRSFREVVLAWRGEPRFILSGDDFRQMGREASYENPVYTIRTLPEKLYLPDGRRAFSRWTGGVIGVLGAQMDDVNNFARQWYIADAVRRY